MVHGRTRRPGELVFAFGLVIFSALAFWQSYAISGFRGLTTAGVFPMLASGTMVLTAVTILAETLRTPADRDLAGGILVGFIRRILPPRLVAMVLLIIAYVAVMPWAGFLLSSAGFLFAACALLWRGHFGRALLVTVVSVVAIHFVFRTVFQVVLPQGVILPGLF